MSTSESSVVIGVGGSSSNESARLLAETSTLPPVTITMETGSQIQHDAVKDCYIAADSKLAEGQAVGREDNWVSLTTNYILLAQPDAKSERGSGSKAPPIASGRLRAHPLDWVPKSGSEDEDDDIQV